MATTLVRPKVYISSTIFDFADLRSALRYYLRELGYDVMLSEYNDFEKPVDLNSYNACISAIDSCDYYILLVGGRAGGRVSEVENTTITQMEYRHAYMRACEKKIRILTFARDSVWAAREDRRGLAEWIASNQASGSSNTIPKGVTSFSSKVVQDADFVFSFLKEIARSSEMKESVKSGKPGPIANWVHVFSGFEDIADVLKVALRTTHNLWRIATELNLRNELLGNAKAMLAKSSRDAVFGNYQFLSRMRDEIHLTDDLLDDCTIPHNHLNGLGIFLIGVMPRVYHELSTTSIDEALRSGSTLRFNAEESTYTPSHITLALQEYRFQVGMLHRRIALLEPEAATVNAKVITANRNSSSVRISTSHLAMAYAVHDSCENVLKLTHHLLTLLRTTGPEMPPRPRLRPISPRGNDNVEKEVPDDSDVLRWMEETFCKRAAM